MDSSTDERLMNIVDEYVERAQKGDIPSVEAYCRDNPDVADELRELLGALDVLDAFQAAQKNDTLPPHTPLPEQFGDYRILGELGRGGMGIVYEAEQESLSRRVALKVLPANFLQSANAPSRFQREARAAARMHHTNIVPVFDVGKEGDVFFYAMQLIDGRSLDEIIDEVRELQRHQSEKTPAAQAISASVMESSQRNTLTPQRGSSASVSGSRSARNDYFRNVARVVVQAADGLAYAHERGVVHRDIKPSNLLLDVEGVTWITDFGLAKMRESDEKSLTLSGDYLGTLRYMSPERFRGRCDERSDIYALGLTLYELVVLQPAFSSEDRVELISEIANTEPARPRTLNHQIPHDLETIILKCIAKEPNRRYQTATQVAEDLTRFLNDEPILARRLSLFEQMLRWTRRNTQLALSFAAIAALLIAFAIGAAYSSIQQSELRETAESEQKKTARALQRARRDRDAADDSRTKATAAEVIARDALQLANERSEELRASLYATEMHGASLTVGTATNLEQLRTVTENWIPSDQATDMRNWEWYFLRSVANDDVVTFEDDELRSPTFILNDTQLAASVGQLPTSHYVQIFDTKTGKRVRRLEGHENGVSGIAWHPKHQRLATASYDGSIRIWRCDTGECLRVIERPNRGLQKLVFTNNHLISFENPGRGSDEVAVFDVQKYQLQNEFPVDTLYGDIVELSPAGNLVLTRDITKGELKLWKTESGKLVQSFPGPGSVIWNEAGNAVQATFVCRTTGEIDVVKGSNVIRTFRGPSSQARTPRLSHDRKFVISGSTDNTVRIWDYDSQEQRRIFQRHRADVETVRESADAKLILSSMLKTFLWRAKPTYRSEYNIPAVGLDWHPDSRRLAVIGGGQLSVIDVETNERTHVANDAGQNCKWSPDGRYLAMVQQVTANGRFDESLSILDGFPPARAIECDAYHTIWEIGWHPTKNQCFFAGNFDIVGFDLESESKLGLMERWNPQRSPNTGSVALHPTAPGQLAVSWGSEIQLRSIHSDAITHTLRGHKRRLKRMEWSPDGKSLASVSSDFQARIWNPATGQTRLLMTGHNNQVLDLAWNHDGRRLATCGSDGTVRIWDTENGNEMFRFDDHQCEVVSVAWSADGRKIASASIRNRVIILDASKAYDSEPSPQPEKKNSSSGDFLMSYVGAKLRSDEWKWTEPSVVPGVNTQHDEYEPSLSADGRILTFHSDRPGGSGGSDLWEARRAAADAPWQEPINIKALNSSSNEESPEISPDGLTLYFVSAKSGSRDLYRVQRQSVEGTWGNIERLPDSVNSPGDDIEPAVSSDGCTMVFASARQPKEGIFDLWITTRENPTSPWTESIHLGNEINLEDWQGSPTLIGDGFGSTLVFHSAKGPYIAHRRSRSALFESALPLESYSEDRKLDSIRSPFLTTDGNTLWFRKYDAESGRYDLWLSRRVKR